MFRIGGFIGSVAVTAALVGAAATGTGAYFTDSKSGSISGTMGTDQDRRLRQRGRSTSRSPTCFPARSRPSSVNYQATRDRTQQDIWVVFDRTTWRRCPTTGLNSLGPVWRASRHEQRRDAVFESNNLQRRHDSLHRDGGTTQRPQGTRRRARTATAAVRCDQAAAAACSRSPLGGTSTFSFTPGAKFKGQNQFARQHGAQPRLQAGRDSARHRAERRQQPVPIQSGRSRALGAGATTAAAGTQRPRTDAPRHAEESREAAHRRCLAVLWPCWLAGAGTAALRCGTTATGSMRSAPAP